MNQIKQASEILKRKRILEKAPSDLRRALREYRDGLTKKVSSFKEEHTEFFKSFFNAFCYIGNEHLKREIIERWDVLQDEWKRLQKLKGMNAVLYGYGKEDSDDPYVHEWKRSGTIIEFVLPSKENYFGGPRLLFEDAAQKGKLAVDDYWLAETLFKGLSEDVGKYELRSLSGKVVFPSREHQSALYVIHQANRLIYTERLI